MMQAITFELQSHWYVCEVSVLNKVNHPLSPKPPTCCPIRTLESEDLPSSPSLRSARQLYEYDLVCRLLLLGFKSPPSLWFRFTSMSFIDVIDVLLDDLAILCFPSLAFFIESKISASLFPSSLEVSRFKETGLLLLRACTLLRGLLFSTLSSLSTPIVKSSRLELLLVNSGFSSCFPQLCVRRTSLLLSTERSLFFVPLDESSCL